MSALVVQAPASTANLGPGFDCAAAALELWNELHVEASTNGALKVEIEGEGAKELPRSPDNLALRAFALFAPADRYRFRFVNRIPLERGLGSSAAAVAAGLVAGAALARRSLGPDRALELGLRFEGHADNLAAALRGGVCLIWQNGAGRHTARIAADLPLAPVIVAPSSRVNTLESRRRLPETVSHEQAAASAAQAALLGAAIVAGDADLLASALHDRLHEPYRLADAPLLEELRARPVESQAGVTLSGSGPSVVVWTEKNDAADAARELGARFPDATVLPLRISDQGTH